jgi:hypothetical protein
VSSLKPPPEYECGKGQPFALEEFVNVPRRHALAPRESSHTQIAVAEIHGYISDNGA